MQGCGNTTCKNKKSTKSMKLNLFRFAVNGVIIVTFLCDDCYNKACMRIPNIPKVITSKFIHAAFC